MGGAFLIERWMEAYLVGAPVSLFVCATMLSGWFGGFGPGLLAAALAILAFDYEPSPNPWMHLIPKDLPRAAIFAVTVVVVALLSGAQRREIESLRRARKSLQKGNEALASDGGATRSFMRLLEHAA